MKGHTRDLFVFFFFLLLFLCISQVAHFLNEIRDRQQPESRTRSFFFFFPKLIIERVANLILVRVSSCSPNYIYAFRSSNCFNFANIFCTMSNRKGGRANRNATANAQFLRS